MMGYPGTRRVAYGIVLALAGAAGTYLYSESEVDIVDSSAQVRESIDDLIDTSNTLPTIRSIGHPRSSRRSTTDQQLAT